MPELDLDAIRVRADAASDGPWTTGHGYEPSWQPHELIISATYPIIEFTNDEQGCADADFVAHAREDVPALLDKINEQKTTIDWAMETIKRLKGDLARLDAQELLRTEQLGHASEEIERLKEGR